MYLQAARARPVPGSPEEAAHRQRPEVPADVGGIEARDAVESPAASHAIDVERASRPCLFPRPRQTDENLLELLASRVRIAHAEEELQPLRDLAGERERAAVRVESGQVSDGEVVAAAGRRQD